MWALPVTIPGAPKSPLHALGFSCHYEAGALSLYQLPLSRHLSFEAPPSSTCACAFGTRALRACTIHACAVRAFTTTACTCRACTIKVCTIMACAVSAWAEGVSDSSHPRYTSPFCLGATLSLPLREQVCALGVAEPACSKLNGPDEASQVRPMRPHFRPTASYSELGSLPHPQVPLSPVSTLLRPGQIWDT